MNITFSCTLDELDTEVILDTTTIKDSNKLFVGLYAYSEALKSCTKITSITDETTIEINQLPLDTGTFNVIFSDLTPYRYLDLCEALKDIQNIVNDNGMFIQLKFRDESNIVRDKLNSIKARSRETTLNLKANPVQFDPTVDQIELAGFLEQHDLIAWFSRKDFLDNGYDFNDIDETRDTAIVMDETYIITGKNKRIQMGNDYLYYVIGLSKK